MKRFVVSMTLTVVFCAAAFAAPVNLVTNGSFEQGTLGIGSFQGWQTTLGDASTFVDSSGQTGTKYGQATDGKWAAYFGSTTADGGASIAQTLTTAVSQMYVLTFDLANDNGGLVPSNDFIATVAGAPVFTVKNLPSQNFVHEQVTFTANDTSTTLQLFAYNDQSYVALDNVVVNAVSVTPEPSSMVLLGTGTLMLGGVVRRRVKRSV